MVQTLDRKHEANMFPATVSQWDDINSWETWVCRPATMLAGLFTNSPITPCYTALTARPTGEKFRHLVFVYLLACAENELPLRRWKFIFRKLQCFWRAKNYHETMSTSYSDTKKWRGRYFSVRMSSKSLFVLKAASPNQGTQNSF